MMNQFKSYINEFMDDESGMELLQFAVIIAITVALIPVVMKIFNTVKGNMETANTQAENEFNALNGGLGDKKKD